MLKSTFIAPNTRSRGSWKFKNGYPCRKLTFFHINVGSNRCMYTLHTYIRTCACYASNEVLVCVPTHSVTYLYFDRAGSKSGVDEGYNVLSDVASRGFLQQQVHSLKKNEGDLCRRETNYV